ncbi:MAG: Na+/H+ antiporter subunit E [Hyphomonadaceae bacterium]|nr:Na+/H+ antiporter subunit E [Hyphomonadaceae bacterium]
MLYATATLAALALFWASLTAPLTPEPVLAAIACGLALGLAARWSALDREGAPYLAAPALIARSLSALVAALAHAPSAAHTFVRMRARLEPGLARVRLRGLAPAARVQALRGLAVQPDRILIDVDDDGALVHALRERDLEEAPPMRAPR